MKADEEEEMIDVCKAWDDHAKEYAKEHVEEYAGEYAKEYAKEHVEEYAGEYAKEYAREHIRKAMIKNIVEMALEFNATQETIITKLCEKLGLSTEEAEQEYENYIAADS